MEMFIDSLKTKGFHDKLKNNHFHIQQKKKKEKKKNCWCF